MSKIGHDVLGKRVVVQYLSETSKTVDNKPKFKIVKGKLKVGQKFYYFTRTSDDEFEVKTTPPGAVGTLKGADYIVYAFPPKGNYAGSIKFVQLSLYPVHSEILKFTKGLVPPGWDIPRHSFSMADKYMDMMFINVEHVKGYELIYNYIKSVGTMIHEYIFALKEEDFKNLRELCKDDGKAAEAIAKSLKAEELAKMTPEQIKSLVDAIIAIT